jgi:DNA-binding CsgD family transcriptional regulator/tetratricopeptide (TPR) repeat protein
MAYGARLAALEDGLRERLVVSALDSRGPDPPSARRSVAYTPDDLMVLEAQGLVTADSTGSRLMFRHPLVRSAVVASVPSQVVRSSHSVLARVHWDDPQRRAWHLGAAALEADDTIAREIADAAEEMAARGGSSNAVSAFERAADLAETGAAVGSHLIRAAATAAEAGQFDKAVALNERARTLVADHDHAARRDLTTALLLMRGDGDLFGARRLLQTAWANTGNSSEELRQQILWMLIAVAYHRFDPDLWADVDRMVRAAGPTSEMVTLTHAFLRDPDRSQADLQHEMRHRAGAVDGSTPPASTVELAHLLRRADLLAEQRAMLEELIRRERGSGALYQVASAHELLGDALLATGEWERAEDLLNAGVALSTRHGLGLCANMCRARLAMLAASRGDRESADQYAQLIERWGRPRGVGLLTVESLRTRALAALADSDHAAAMALYIQLLDFELPVSCSALTPWYVFDLTHCAIRTGQPGIGRTAAGQVRGLGAQVLTPRSAMLLDAADALLAPDDHADAAFRRALAPLMTDRWPFDKARVRLAFGERLRRTAGPTAARVELRRAADAFAQLGATAWQAQAEQELRATGVTVPASSSPRDGAGRSGELTPQQREVVDLAATGLSNKDIAAKLYLSPRTVSAHLYRAFPKLGVTSRSALRDALTDP